MNAAPEVEPPVGVAAMAEYLGKSEYTIRLYAKNNVIPGHRLGTGPKAPWCFYLSEVREHLTAKAADPWVSVKKPRGRRQPAA